MTKSGWYCSTPNNLPSVKGHHAKLHVCTSDMVDANIGYVEMWTNIRISLQTLQNYNRISVWRYCSEISMWEDLHGLNPMYSLPQNTCVFTVSIHTSIYACFFSETTTKGQGFQGCLFRAQWDNLYPLARVFQDPRGPNIILEPPSKC